MKRREAASLATDALKLRRWALRLLTLPGSTQHPEIPQAISPRAWELFLRAERCALPLRRQLSALAVDRDLPADVERVIAVLALEETQRVVSARAQLKHVSQWAISAGVDVVVLKGGVAAVDDSAAVDLSDIDLWIEPGTENSLLDWLSGSGHIPRQNAAGHHHASRLADQLVSIEVHHEIPHADLDTAWTLRTRPIEPAFPRLKRPDAADNLWHVLIHSTMQHIERRGRVRDVLLLAHAQSLCTANDRQAVLRRARAHPGAVVLIPMIEMSAAVGTGRDSVDPFLLVAAGRYLDTASGPHRPAFRFLHSNTATTAVLYGLRGCTHQIDKVFRTRGATSPVPVLRSLQHHSPRIGGAIVLSLRIAKRAAALLFALPRAQTARRLAGSATAT